MLLIDRLKVPVCVCVYVFVFVCVCVCSCVCVRACWMCMRSLYVGQYIRSCAVLMLERREHWIVEDSLMSGWIIICCWIFIMATNKLFHDVWINDLSIIYTSMNTISWCFSENLSNTIDGRGSMQCWIFMKMTSWKEMGWCVHPRPSLPAIDYAIKPMHWGDDRGWIHIQVKVVRGKWEYMWWITQQHNLCAFGLKKETRNSIPICLSFLTSCVCKATSCTLLAYFRSTKHLSLQTPSNVPSFH